MVHDEEAEVSIGLATLIANSQRNRPTLAVAVAEAIDKRPNSKTQEPAGRDKASAGCASSAYSHLQASCVVAASNKSWFFNSSTKFVYCLQAKDI